MTNNVLLVDYSWSGTTTKMADLLQKLTGADRVDLTVAAATFSTDMYATADIANKQLATGNLPELTNARPDLTGVSLILVGGPVWSGKVATPVRSFLSQLSTYQGTVVPFYTDAGTPGGYEADLKQLIPAVKVAPGIGMSASQLAHAEPALQTWWHNLKK